ncbi:MAG: ATPase domain-containing protein [archaeon]
MEKTKERTSIITKKSNKKTIQENRIPTGIKEFDKMVEGGFEHNSINLVVGGNGSGKTIFGVEFLLEGVRKGENVLYITFEESKKEFYKNLSKLGWEMEKAEKSGKFTFLEYSPEKVEMMLDEGGGMIESLVYQKKIKRMVIDSISSFTLLFENKSSKRQAILSLFDTIRKWDLTTLLTLQKDPLEKKESGFTSAELQSDSSILFYYARIGKERKRFVEVSKMRGTKHSTEIREFSIDKGIKIGKILSDNTQLERIK